MDEKQQPPTAQTQGSWWFGWIICTLVFPACFGVGFGRWFQTSAVIFPIFGLLSIGALILHIVASIKLSNDRTGIIIALLLGGWALMAVTFFVGCVLNFNLRS